MKITTIALDTRGGVQPYAALALGLQAGGHEVTIAVTEDYAGWLRSLGLRVLTVPGDTQETVRSLSGGMPSSRREHAKLMRSRTSKLVDAAVEAILNGSADSQVFTGGVGGGLVGRPIAEKLGVPFVDSHLQPLGPATGAYPGVLVQLPDWLGAAGRKAGHWLSDLAMRVPFGPGARHARELLGLPRTPPTPDPTVPVLYGYSPLVVPKPREWGPERTITGYWTLPAPKDWTPPPELLDFLDAGPPPICVGFGSMHSGDPEALADLVVTAGRDAGARLILVSGWGGLAGKASDDVLTIDSAPYDWLLPHTAGMVHPAAPAPPVQPSRPAYPPS